MKVRDLVSLCTCCLKGRKKNGQRWPGQDKPSSRTEGCSSKRTPAESLLGVAASVGAGLNCWSGRNGNICGLAGSVGRPSEILYQNWPSDQYAIVRAAL